MRVLVTGGAGFVGSHLCDLLLEQGHAVSALDDLSTGSLENCSCGIVVMDIGDEPEITEAHVEASDAIVHLAAVVGVDLVMRDPLATIERNVACTQAVLAAAARHDKPVLLASTSEVYGNGPTPFVESQDLHIGPGVRWSYATAKLLDEQLAAAYRQQYGLHVTVARLFNTVGPRQSARYGMVLPRFVKQALAGEPLTVYGTGEQTRCFCHVRDVVKALALLLDRPGGETFNVGSTHETSIEHLARYVLAVTGSDSMLEFVPHPCEDVTHRVPDITRIWELGWRPERSLGDTIKDIASVVTA